jgi:hypothetical protein
METMIFLLFIPFFALLWLGITGLIWVIGGWRALAQSNPVPPVFPEAGETFSFQSVRFGFLGNYNSCITITVYSDGVRIVPIFLFSLFHKALYFSYNKMSNPAFGRFFLHYVTFNSAGRKIMIMGKSAQVIKEKLGPR